MRAAATSAEIRRLAGPNVSAPKSREPLHVQLRSWPLPEKSRFCWGAKMRDISAIENRWEEKWSPLRTFLAIPRWRQKSPANGNARFFWCTQFPELSWEDIDTILFRTLFSEVRSLGCMKACYTETPTLKTSQSSRRVRIDMSAPLALLYHQAGAWEASKCLACLSVDLFRGVRNSKVHPWI